MRAFKVQEFLCALVCSIALLLEEKLGRMRYRIFIC